MSRIGRAVAYLGIVFVLVASIAKAGERNETAARGNQIVAKPIGDVVKEQARKLAAIPGVVGAAHGVCDGRPCVKVFVIEKTPQIAEKVPATLDGYPVVIEVTGPIKALPAN